MSKRTIPTGSESMISEFQEHILKSLKHASPEKPWMTARTIAKKMSIPSQHKEVESALFHYLEQQENLGEPSEVRYSSLPSRKTLEVLWGACKSVGKQDLPNITKDNVADEFPDGILTREETDIFISHSHRDFKDVLEVATHLIDAGISPWLAETHINQGEHIHEEIISAINQTQALLLFLSSNALGSRWTGKECEYAMHNGIPIYVVANIDDDTIRLLLDVMSGEPEPQNWQTLFSSNFQEFIHGLNHTDELIAATYAYSRTKKLDAGYKTASPLRSFLEKKTKRSNL